MQVFSVRRLKEKMEMIEFKGINRYLGLMFRKIDPNKIYVFKFDKPGKIPIHTLFVREPIDVAWFDTDGIIDVKTVKPNQFFVSHKGLALGFMETKSGEIHFAGQN